MKKEVSGVLVIDKPINMTAAKLTAKVKKITKAGKAGHAGTLDPFATGVMICCIDRATRLADFFLKGRKTYEGVIFLGVDTDTQDATGNIVAQSAVPAFPDAKIRSVADMFTGEILQAPPVYSALKHHGKPLYRLAREGNPVQKPPRRVEIFSLTIRKIALPEISFEVTCSAGTYIRTLAADIGKALGCGAHLKTLRRTESCGFGIAEALDIASLEDIALSGALHERIIKPAAALRNLPEYMADEELARKIGFGQPLTASDFPWRSSATHMKIVDRNRSLLAVIHPGEDRQKYSYCCVFNNGSNKAG